MPKPDVKKNGKHQHTTDEMRKCAEECRRCHDMCLETLQHCLHEGGEYAEPHHVRLLMDCVQICHTSADFMLRGSDLHKYICEACAEVCARCADGCARLDGAHMKRCADACRRCAASCHKMAT